MKPKGHRAISAFIYMAFFLSGAAALVYEVVWTRQLTLLFGATTSSVSVVLSAYMLGLALGGYIGARLSHRFKRHLLLYGVFEACIGVCAVAIMALLAYLGGNPEIFAPIADSPALLAVVKFTFSFALLSVPTTLMGLTLPLLSGFLGRTKGSFVAKIGRLYGLNTLGAMAGCVAAGFVFVPYLGLKLSTITAIAINLAIGALAVILQKSVPESDAVVKTEAGGKSKSPALVLLTSAGIGFSILALEVVWMRSLVQSFFGTTYSFTVMLANVLLGIGIGGVLAKRFAGKWNDRNLLPGLMILIATVTAAGIPLLSILPGLIDPLKLNISNWLAVLGLRSLITWALLIIPTTASGACFVVLANLASQGGKSAGEGVGRTYTFNTVGAMAGAPFAEYVVLQHYGPNVSAAAFCILLFVLAGVYYVKSGQVRRALPIFASVVFFPALLFCISNPLMPDSIRGEQIIAQADDAVGNVKVCRLTKGRNGFSLRVNNRKIGGTDAHYHESRFGYLPVILAPGKVESALMIGLGTGATYEALDRAIGKAPVAVELMPSLPRFTGFFTRTDISKEPYAGNIIIADGRNYLLMHKEKYDLILLDVYHPDSAGISNLYSKDFYILSSSRLNNGGIFAQWVAAYQMSPRILDIIGRTFGSAFADAHFWSVDFGSGAFAVLMIGSNEPIKYDREKIRRMADDLKFFPDIPEGRADGALQSLFISDGWQDIAPGEDRINTDDIPVIEFLAPQAAWRTSNYGEKNWALLLNKKPKAQVPDYYRAREAVNKMAEAIQGGNSKCDKEQIANLEKSRNHLGYNTRLEILAALCASRDKEWHLAVDRLRTALSAYGISTEAARMLSETCAHFKERAGCLPGEAKAVGQLVVSNPIHGKLYDIGPSNYKIHGRIMKSAGELAALYYENGKSDSAIRVVNAMRCYSPGDNPPAPKALPPDLRQMWPSADCYHGNNPPVVEPLKNAVEMEG